MMWSRRINAILISFWAAAHLGFEHSPVAAAASVRRAMVKKGEEPDLPLRAPTAAPSVSNMPSAGKDFEEQEVSTPSPSISGMPSASEDLDEQDLTTPSPSVSGMPSGTVEAQGLATPSPSVSSMPSNDDFGEQEVFLCGDSNCPSGEVCCNYSCGICTPPGGSCIQMNCNPKE
ncbi:hypothetical protein ACA910_014773 [Epithemia clementina (nom. ined.)]